jgi:hypothetical protein
LISLAASLFQIMLRLNSSLARLAAHSREGK